MAEPLERRLRRLELENRVHRLALVAVAIAATQCGSSSVTANFALVRANRLEIVDGSDRPVLTLTAREGGAVTFVGETPPVQIDAATLRRLQDPK